MKQKKTLVTNAILNIVKQLMAILFPVITVYYASRALGQEQFGAINYVRSVVSYFSLFAGLGTSTYAIREGAYFRADKMRYDVFASQVFTINVISTTISFTILLLLVLLPGSIFVRYRALMIVFATSFLLQTLGADWVNSTHEDFMFITVRYCLINLLAIILLFLLVHNENDGLRYAGILVFASTGGNILNVFYIRRYADLRLSFSRECLKHIKPILLLFSIEVATSIYINSDTTMLGVMINNAAVATYTVASNIYIAVKRVSNAAVTVALPRLSYYVGSKNESKYQETIDDIINSVITLMLPCLVGVFALSKNLMMLMGGEKYYEGAAPLRILSIALFFAVFAFVLSRCVLLPFKEDKTYMVATIISAAINIGLNFFLIPRYSFNGAALTTLISEAIVCTIMLRKSRMLVQLHLDIMNLLKTVVACISIAILCMICNLCFKNEWIAVLSSFVLGVLAFGLILLGTKHPLAIKILKLSSKKVL